jgi:hypothetical protein
MDWRRPIEQQKPVAPATPQSAQGSQAQNDRWLDSDEYRRATRNPDLIEHAIQARAYTERLRREARGL